MGNIAKSLEAIMEIDGAVRCALGDSTSGMVLGQAGGGADIAIAVAGNTEVIRSKMKTMKLLGYTDEIEDILITLGKQYHILRPKGTLFLYLVLDKNKANLALARYKLNEVAEQLSV